LYLVQYNILIDNKKRQPPSPLEEPSDSR
jgi:hypothetical protein